MQKDRINIIIMISKTSPGYSGLKGFIFGVSTV